MYCVKCGKQVPDGVIVCEDCQKQDVAPVQEEQVEQPVVEVQTPVQVEQTIEAPKPVSKKGNLFSILGFVSQILLFVIVNAIVVMYNIEYGFQVLDYSVLGELTATAELYKSYLLIIALVSLVPLSLAIVGMVISSKERKKGFISKKAKVFAIITIVLVGVTIMNCLLNQVLIGRYEIQYYYY